MFRVGERVWHQQHKEGTVAYVMPSDTRVYFDEMPQNELVENIEPVYVTKDDLSAMAPGERASWESKMGTAPLDNHVIYWNADAYEAPAYGQYNYPIIDGFYKVTKVQKPFSIKAREGDPQHFKAPDLRSPMKKMKFHVLKIVQK